MICVRFNWRLVDVRVCVFVGIICGVIQVIENNLPTTNFRASNS